MSVSIERPSAQEMEQLVGLLEKEPLDRETLCALLRGIEGGLRARRGELESAGGLIDRDEQVGRQSLARQDERLRKDLTTLANDLQAATNEVEGTVDDGQVRTRIRDLATRIQHHQSSEAKLVLESTTTEVGAGD